MKNQVREGTFLAGLFILGRVIHTQINNFYFFRITQVHVEKRISYREARVRFCASEKSNHVWKHICLFFKRITQILLELFRFK